VVSGPVGIEDTQASSGDDAATAERTLEITTSREAVVGALTVRRALPRRGRRTVGAWCFADHMGPADVTADGQVDIGPHPHMGLQTVTWLVSGELVHRDSLGSEQTIQPGQLNLMTAGRGVSHAEEETPGFRGELQGIQLWVAQPAATRHGDAAFEHHAALPEAELTGGTATILIGSFDQVSSPARRDTDHVGMDLDLHGPSLVPLDPAYEYGVIVLVGALEVEGQVVEPGHLAYLGTGRSECTFDVRVPSRALLLGGVPFEDDLVMWWNFVGRDRDEMVEAYRHWADDDGWFGQVASNLRRIPVDPPAWLTTRP
jgi:redox-sensitive bicupin YhaK (pirin superfamily)